MKKNFSSTESKSEPVGLSLREDETQISPYEVSHLTRHLTYAFIVLVHIWCWQTPCNPMLESIQLRGGVEVWNIHRYGLSLQLILRWTAGSCEDSQPRDRWARDKLLRWYPCWTLKFRWSEWSEVDPLQSLTYSRLLQKRKQKQANCRLRGWTSFNSVQWDDLMGTWNEHSYSRSGA